MLVNIIGGAETSLNGKFSSAPVLLQSFCTTSAVRWCWDTRTSPSAMQTLGAWECAMYIQQQLCAPAEPLYKERSEVVVGQKDVPVSYADRAEEGEEAEEAAEKIDTPAPAEEEGEIPAGVPEFWLGAMRAHPLISEHVRLAIPLFPAVISCTYVVHARAESMGNTVEVQPAGFNTMAWCSACIKTLFGPREEFTQCCSQWLELPGFDDEELEPEEDI